MRRQSRLVLSWQGNELDRDFAMISLWHFILRVAGFLVSDTGECRVQEIFFSAMEVNECIRKLPSHMI